MIADTNLSFPPPKIFTNALLHSHDITALIRDTETHEPALFTSPTENRPATDIARRSTIHGLDNTHNFLKNGLSLFKVPRQGSAVSALLNNELDEEIRKGGNDRRDRGEVNVDILLNGAEKLCGI